MKLILKGLLLSLLVSSGVMANEVISVKTVKPTTSVTTQTHDVRVFVSDNKDGKITPKLIEEVFEKAGFVIAANNNMNAPFMRDFNNTTFDVYNLFAVFRKDTVLALAENYPEIGLFSPMTMSIYTKKGDTTISISSLRPSAMARMMNIPQDNPAILDLDKKIVDTLKSIMPNGKFVALNYKMKKPTENIITRVSYKQKGDDWEDAKDDFQMAFESELARNRFVMAGFSDLNFDLDDNDKDWYTFYDVYSICKIEVIYEVAKTHPEAGAFAPCSAYMYQKKDDETVYMAFPNVHKWIAALNIQDKKTIEVLLDAQKRFESILAKVSK